MEALANISAKKDFTLGESFGERRKPREKTPRDRVLTQWESPESTLIGTVSIMGGDILVSPKKEYRITYEGELVIKLSSTFKDLCHEIESSKYILELEEDWDDNGASSYEFETWEKAIKFLVKYNQWTYEKTGEIVSPPKIYHGPEGCIDLLWKTEEYQLLVKIPKNDEIATFYGDDYGSTKIQGKLDIKGKKNDGFIFSLLHFSQQNLELKLSRVFDQEDIPDEDELYYRIHHMYVRGGNLTPGVFKERVDEDGERGMSTDWEKYSTPEESKERARKPEDNGIVSLEAGGVRNINLDVIHEPLGEMELDNGTVLPPNQAHSNITREEEPIQNSEEIRLKLLDLSNWEIKV